MTKSEPTVSSKEDSQNSDESDRRKLGKIRVDASSLQAGGGGGGCPMEKFMYIIFAVLGMRLSSSAHTYIHKTFFVIQVFCTQFTYQTRPGSLIY